jgi:hypothetical protein
MCAALNEATISKETPKVKTKLIIYEDFRLRLCIQKEKSLFLNTKEKEKNYAKNY